MVSVNQLKKYFYELVAIKLAERGYKKKRGNLFVCGFEKGYKATAFQICDYNYMTTSMDYLVRYDDLQLPVDYVTYSIGFDGWEGKRLQELKRDIAENSSFGVSWNALAGIKEHTTDNITATDEIPMLCDRWIERFDSTQHDFFGMVDSIEKITVMFENEDAFLSKLNYQSWDSTFMVGFLALYVARGYDAAKLFSEKHAKYVRHSNKTYVEGILSAKYPITELP